MTNQHPITPPPELVQQWTSLANEGEGYEVWSSIALWAAQWGADTELQQCCDLVDDLPYDGATLRAARRPPAPDGAIAVLDDLDSMFDLPSGHYNTLLSALTALPQ